MTIARPARLLLTGALAAALLLAGCAGESPTDPGTDGTPTGGTPTATESATVPSVDSAEGMPTASGVFGEAPVFTFPSDTPPADLQVQVLSEGDGPVVAPGAVLTANYIGQVWGADASFDDSYSRGKPSMFSLDGVVSGWTQGIPNHTVGSRLLISIPPALGYGPAGGNAGAGIGPEDTIVFVVDVVAAFNPDMTGEAAATVVTDPTGLPVTLDGALGEPVTFTVRDGFEAPTEPQIIRIADGSGAPLALGQQAAVAFAVTYWDNTEGESSWAMGANGLGGPLVANLGQGTIFDLLDGVPVGSRVLLMAPAGADGTPALAVVVDVLGAA